MTSIVTLLLVVLVSGAGCSVWDAHHAAIDAAQNLPPVSDDSREGPLPDRLIFREEGRCQVRCTLIRTLGKYRCEPYRC